MPVVAGLALAAVLGACGGATVSGPAATSPGLRAWSSFPVRSSPRPLVLPQGSVVGPAGGFRTDADKVAFGAGAFVAPSHFPEGPSERGGFQLISAAAGFAALRSTGTGESATKLTVSGVDLGSATFLTDRGRRRLPAWLFSFVGVENPAAVLAVARSDRFWPRSVGHDRYTILAAHVDHGERKLTVTFPGAPAGTGPCTADYAGSATESAEAVSVTVRATRGGASDNPGAVCSLVGYPRRVTVVLKTPLGARVVVDARTGAPLVVTG